MTDPGPPARGASHADARAFILAFAAHAGRGGVGAVALVAAGALLEGVGLALLLHVTVLVAALTLLYRGVEAVATRVPLLAGAVVVGGVAASVVLVLDALV